MKTLQVQLDEKLMRRLDKAVESAGTTRKAWVAGVLREALRVRDMEARHAEGYRKHPPAAGEFDVWEKEQVWGEP